jgi:hypothetical protein
MIGLITITLLGTLILVFGIRLILQSRHRTPGQTVAAVDDYAKAREALDSLLVETAAIRRVFSVEDAEFIARSATPEVQSLFLDERKKLALEWFRRTREQVARLMDLHLRLAGYTYDPSPRFEFKLTASYLTFMVASKIALALLWLLGPFNTSGVISRTVLKAANFCTIFSLRLEQVDPTRLRSGSESLVH